MGGWEDEVSGWKVGGWVDKKEKGFALYLILHKVDAMNQTLRRAFPGVPGSAFELQPGVSVLGSACRVGWEKEVGHARE